MAINLQGKTLKEYKEIKNLGELALSIWRYPKLSKSLDLSDKSNILATLLQSNKWKEYTNLIKYIELPEITRTCQILDSCRRKKQLEKHLEKNIIHASKQYINHIVNTVKFPQVINHITHKHKLDIIKCDNLNQGLHFSLTSTRIHYLKQWVNNC